MGAQPDGIRQPICPGNNMIHHACFLIVNVEIRPDGDGDKQRELNRYDQLQDNAVTEMIKLFEHGITSI
jgi:hypothetical protein